MARKNIRFTSFLKKRRGNKVLTSLSSEDEMAAKHEALFYSSTPKGVVCLLCPNHCLIKNGQIGECRTRKNENGTLYSLAYGNPIAVNIDPIEKKPLYHYLPGSQTLSFGTAGCNLACLNCQNSTISQKSPLEVAGYDLMPEDVVEFAVEKDCKSIAYTYTDPVVFYEYVLDTARFAKECDLKNIIVSAGYIEEKPLREWCKYIDAANIDLKCFDDEIYQTLNSGRLEPVLRTLKILKEEGIWLEITNLVIPEWTDDLGMIKRMCQWLVDNGFENTPLHFSRFSPMYKLTEVSATSTFVLEQALSLAKSSGMNYVYIGNVRGHVAENTFCPSCKKRIVKRDGYSILDVMIKEGRCGYCNSNVQGIWE